jgi:hypothetical protein
MKPTVGRIVHYTNLGDQDGRYPPEQQAAIITKVKPKPLEAKYDPTDEDAYAVSLHIFYETGDFYMQDVPFSFAYQRGHWTWPKKEADEPTYTILINGRQYDTKAQVISYDELVKLAKLEGHPTVTWRMKCGHSGILAPGEQVTTIGEVVINVCHTDNG